MRHGHRPVPDEKRLARFTTRRRGLRGKPPFDRPRTLAYGLGARNVRCSSCSGRHHVSCKRGIERPTGRT
ncbi:hypothetical protein ABU614_20670 [Lysobacter firmicutimachus]|uniref:Zinc finger LSD1-type domain-containing protein n=1 Tax=Lysobacter firmicutimachus TaxID=1792846 RepID=A0AAU8MQF0_9GAMM